MWWQRALLPTNCDQVGHYWGDLPGRTSGNAAPSFFSHNPGTLWVAPWESRPRGSSATTGIPGVARQQTNKKNLGCVPVRLSIAVPSPPLPDYCWLSASIPARCRAAGRSSGMEQCPTSRFLYCSCKISLLVRLCASFSLSAMYGDRSDLILIGVPV